MLRFLKIFLGQLLKIGLVVVGVSLGFYLALQIDLWLYPQQNELPSQWLLLLCGAVGFLLSVAIPFLIEYRRRLDVWSFLGETLLMLIALVCIAIGIAFGIAVGLAGGMAQGDEHGFIIMFLAFLGAVLAIIPGVLLGALVTAFWKFWRGSRNNLSETISQLS